MNDAEGEGGKAGPRFAEEHAEVRRARGLARFRAAAASLAVPELLFASFAAGAAFGPLPLSALELLFGFTASTLLGVTVAFLASARQVERGARLKGYVTEGRHRRRLVAFDGYLTIGNEIVLFSAISSLELEEKALVIRYADAAVGGAVLRELLGDRSWLEKIAHAARVVPAVGREGESPNGSGAV